VIAHLANQRCCLSAQEVLDGLRAEGRAVGIASVYRALDQLAELGPEYGLATPTSRYE